MAGSVTSRPVTNHVPDELGVVAGRRSQSLLWWIPASPVVGFLLAELFLSETWPLWQVVPLAVLLASPFAAGAFYGLQAIRHGNGRGWIGLLVHLAFVLVAVGMPLSQGLTV
jgi:hypothetical protein